MTISSRFTSPIPKCSIQQWIFGSASGYLPNKKAWIDADHPDEHFLSLPEARLLAKRIAVGLQEHGLKPGDRVLLSAGNSIYFPVLVLGIWMAQGIFTGANPGFTARELAFQLADSQAALMIAGQGNLDVALEAAGLVNLETSRVFLFDAISTPCSSLESLQQTGTRHWTELLASHEKGDAFEWIEPTDPFKATCTLNYSSGTTGLPKGVEISHHNHVANGVGIVTLNKLYPDYEERVSRAAALCFLPMYHAFGQGYFLSSLPYEGVPVYVMPCFSLPNMLSHVERFRVTRLLAVPPILLLMSKHPLARRVDLTSIESIGSGAAPLAMDTQREINHMMPSPGPQLRQGWGMTEVTCTAISWDPTRSECNGVGELMPDCQARLVDTGTGDDIIKAETPGELWIAGPTLMRGYWRNAKATNEAITTDNKGTRWLRTGDIAYVEAHKTGTLFHIVDRYKELIKVKGHQVAPAELEALLMEQPDVADAGVIGVTVDSEEVPRAYVVKVPGATTSEEDVADWLAGRVVQYKQLRGGVAFIDAIPKNHSGKVLRRVLRERARRELRVRAKL